jgi:hypothetical protein
MRSPFVSLSIGWLAGLFVAALTGLAAAIAYGGGLRGAQRLSEGEKAACELAGWAVGALVGSYVAAKLHSGLRPLLALLLGVALYVVNGTYFMWMPMPASFWLIGAVVSVGGSIAGAALGSVASTKVSGA